MKRHELEHLVRAAADIADDAEIVATATLPANWKDRLVLVCGPQTRFVKGWCLETHDLVLSKYVAGREKDTRFIRAAIAAGYVNRAILLERLPTMPVGEAQMDSIRRRIAADFAAP